MQEKDKSNEHNDAAVALIDLIPDSVAILDNEGKIIAANKNFGRYTGHKLEELVGKNILEQSFLGKGERSILEKNMKRRLKGYTVPSYEIKIKTKSGDPKFLEIDGNKIDYEGKICDLVVFHDVTERSNHQKRLQQELLNSEEKFRRITNSIRDAIILVDEEAKITYWNPAAEKTFGYTSEEATGKDIHELVIPQTMCREGKERVEAGVRTFGQTGMGYFTVGNVEVLGTRKDGSEFPAKLSISPMKLGGKWNAVGVVKDVTYRRVEEAKLREAEQRYHVLFNQAPLGILIIDPETMRFVEFNDVAPLQLGYTREEFGKLTVYDISGQDEVGAVDYRMAEILRNGGAEFESKHRTRKGNVRNVLVSALTLRLADKTFVHGVFHDITEMRNTQNALMESETRYRQLVELAQEGIWAIDNNFNTVFVNPRMAQMLGYAQSEMAGKNLVEFLDKNMVEKSTGILRKFDQPGIKGQYEYAFPRKDGTHIDASLAVSTITDDRGQVVGKLALVADITERKKLEDELIASEERFRAISVSAMDAIILVDDEDKIIYWNPASERTFGYEEKEVLGKKLGELVIPQQGQANHLAVLQEVIQKPFFEKHFEASAMRKNGTEFPMELSLTSVKLHDRNCMLAIVRDISDRKTMQDALKQERDMLENMAASMDAGLTLISEDYRILWANQLLKQVSADEVENKLCYAVYDQSDRVCPDCGVRKVFETGVAVDRHDYHMKLPGRDEWVELIVTPVRDKNGKVVAALELAVNITERKRLQTKLAEYSQRLEELVQHRTLQLRQTQAELVKSERLAAIGELAGMVGHDLRNPLTGIKNSAYFLKKKGPQISPAQAKEMLEIIEKCVDYSNKIVNDLLDYSRDIRLELQECSPRQLMLESLAMVQVPDKVRIVNNLSHKQALMADPDKIKRVFVNLIKNAIDAMPDGGKLTINGKVKGNFEISIKDTGIGISDEVLPKLFSPLFTTKAKGMGFGLAICKRIVEAHGGTITVKTAKNQGTTFTFTLPIEPKLEIGGEKIWVNMPESSSLTTTKT
jgi:PAS domain S-box-containing protein